VYSVGEGIVDCSRFRILSELQAINVHTHTVASKIATTWAGAVDDSKPEQMIDLARLARLVGDCQALHGKRRLILMRWARVGVRNH